jgi:hypothetical protein
MNSTIVIGQRGELAVASVDEPSSAVSLLSPNLLVEQVQSMHVPRSVAHESERLRLANTVWRAVTRRPSNAIRLIKDV